MNDAHPKYTIEQDFEYHGDDWWSWWLWIEGSPGDLDVVDYVVYTLHPTFPQPVRTVRDRHSKFLIKTEGWGTFRIYAKVVLKDRNAIDLTHELSLKYPDGSKNVE
jgi:transcription initiation factor IIF auxiliary subunit